mmetsp:Transcript_20524/g.44910  ORF Transcript_20524/g.44910 Transcript_20524/m.44910 type:complete len:337 (-) Transcript_20524:769-1779(-)
MAIMLNAFSSTCSQAGTMFILKMPASVVMRPSATMFEVSSRSAVMSSLRFWSRPVLTRSSVSLMYSSRVCSLLRVCSRCMSYASSNISTSATSASSWLLKEDPLLLLLLLLLLGPPSRPLFAKGVFWCLGRVDVSESLVLSRARRPASSSPPDDQLRGRPPSRAGPPAVGPPTPGGSRAPTRLLFSGRDCGRCGGSPLPGGPPPAEPGARPLGSGCLAPAPAAATATAALLPSCSSSLARRESSSAVRLRRCMSSSSSRNFSRTSWIDSTRVFNLTSLFFTRLTASRSDIWIFLVRPSRAGRASRSSSEAAPSSSVTTLSKQISRALSSKGSSRDV